MMAKPIKLFSSFEHFLGYKRRWCRADIIYPCLVCQGKGKIYHPDDPRDPYEGNKLRRIISCSCNNGEGTREENMKSYNEWKTNYKTALDNWKAERLHIQKALKKLLPYEREILGYPRDWRKL